MAFWRLLAVKSKAVGFLAIVPPRLVVLSAAFKGHHYHSNENNRRVVFAKLQGSLRFSEISSNSLHVQSFISNSDHRLSIEIVAVVIAVAI